MMYSMWEVHELVTTYRDARVREADRARLRQHLRAAPRHGGEGRGGASRWAWPAAVLAHWFPRRAAAARR